MKYTLITGKYQPFDDTHETQVRALLDKGKNVCIAVQTTMRDKKNPYSIEQRMRMIQDRLKLEIFNRKVVVSVIPNIEEIIQ